VPDIFATLSPEGYPLYLANFPNVRGEGRPYHEYVRNETELQHFIAANDRVGRALYFTVAALKTGAPRSKENVELVCWVWAEVDFKDHPTLTSDEIRRRIETSFYPPTIIIASGHGFHCYWRLNEPVDARPGPAQQAVETALQLACTYIGGDTQAAEAARVLRLPGSHNSKEADNVVPVEIVANNGRHYEMDDLVDFWREARPILPKPVKTNGGSYSSTSGPADSGPIDVEARLRDMRYKGEGDAAIHWTQLQCTGALARRLVPLADIIAQVLDATQKAVADDPRCQTWDWTKEERTIEGMITNLINKDPTLAPCLPDELFEKFQAMVSAGKKPEILRNAAGLYIHETIKSAAEEPHTDTTWPTPYSGRPPAQIPQRRLVLGKHYCIGACSVTASAGGYRQKHVKPS
jgi:hypothetical protein